MAFGVIASPFLLSATIKHHLRENPNEYAARIESDLYADNLVVSLPRDSSFKQFYPIVKGSFGEMSMNLSKWATNSKELRETFSIEDRLTEREQLVLGSEWNTEDDSL